MEDIDKNKKGLSRRKFLQRMILAIFSIEIAYLLFDYLKNKTTDNSTNSWMSIGSIDNYEMGMHPISKGKFYLYKLADGGIMAISYKCSHLGCAININKDDNGFECPCHASHFNQYGEVKSPPATRPLDIFPIEIKNNEIRVDINHPIKRNKFEQSQITYA